VAGIGECGGRAVGFGAARALVEAAESEAKEATAERDAREKAELTRALGLESDGKIPVALRAQIRQLEEDQKRRAKRARTDVLDRAMIDLLSFYRDVLTTQMGSDVERVNLDLSDAVDQAARTTSPEQSLARIAAIEGEIAERIAGRNGGRALSRAVGGAVSHNAISLLIPCHRVSAEDGSLRGYAGGIWRKRKLLAMERGEN